MSGEHDLYSNITEIEGCNYIYEEASSVIEFKHNLGAEFLESEKGRSEGWVFWWPERDHEGSISSSANKDIISGRTVPERVTLALKTMSEKFVYGRYSLVQFWSPKEMEGRCYLTTMGQPFSVKHLHKGLCWHIKKCMEHEYHVYDGAEDEHLGPPGRVFRNGRPESSPDLLFYSNKEFPLRVHSANCGLRSYYAMPVFDLKYKHCIGVLEFMDYQGMEHYSAYSIRDIYYALQVADMRSTHTSSDKPQTRRNVKAVLQLAIKEVPQLHLAQVWVPCKQCCSIGNYVYCMERAIHVTDSQVEHASPRPAFHDACAFLNLQNGQGIAGLALLSESKSCFCRNLNDFGISEYPMAHYAQQARFSSCFAICASTSKENETQVFEFFLQLGSRDDAYIYSIFGLLIHIMKMKLKRFKIANGGHLLEKYLATDEVRHQHPFKCPIIHNRLGQINQHSNENVAKRIGCNATYSLSEFREYLHEPNLSCLPVPLTYENGWICWREKGDHENNSLMPSLSPSLQKKVKFLLGEILSLCTCDPSIIQLWAHETIENRSCLSTSNQPFALGLLYKGLCQYRKQCMDSYYYVGNGATDDELGPPGRVFLSGLPESSPDLRLYSAKEFPLQDHLANYHTRRYLALPLFDLHHEKCIGVLEVVGCPYKYKDIEKIIEAVNMRWKHVSYSSWFKIVGGQKLAIIEINEMLELVIKSPLLQVASVWISSSKSSDVVDVQMNYFERIIISSICRKDPRIRKFCKACKFHQVQSRKGGFGRLVDSQQKMLFCKSFGDSSKTEQPLAHHAQVARLDTYFAICLQSWHTGDDFYVIEFFVSPGSNKDGYLQSYLSFLLSIMKEKLKSFKVASGKQLGKELVFEVGELGYQNLGHCIGPSSNVIKHFMPDSANSVEAAGEGYVDMYERLEAIESSFKRARTIAQSTQQLANIYTEDARQCSDY